MSSVEWNIAQEGAPVTLFRDTQLYRGIAEYKRGRGGVRIR